METVEIQELEAVVAAQNEAPVIRWPYLQLLRPRQWVKNAFVLAPLIFAGAFWQPSMVVRALGAFGFFCLAASAIYVLNDLVDLERDRLHPTKRLKRPLAAGLIRPGQAIAVLAALALVLLAGIAFSPRMMAVVAVYLLLNVGYSFRLKHWPVVDLFCVASGFVLRILAGAVALPVPLSNWMLVTTLCLALYLATVKRRQELQHSGSSARGVLQFYTIELLDRYAEMAAMGALVFYALFTMTVRPALAVTVPLVLFGMFRYWFLVERGEGESPTDIVWNDPTILAVLVAWVVLCAACLTHHGLVPRL